MKIAIYDANPGDGFGQWLLKLSWRVGCWLFCRLGKLDAYYGHTDWNSAIDEIRRLNLIYNQKIEVQYWGHGLPGNVYMAGVPLDVGKLVALRGTVSHIWFRTCSTFQGEVGHDFSEKASNLLNCPVSGHTRIIGLLHGGLHTRYPLERAKWPIAEGEITYKWPYMKWGNNTVWFFTMKVPHGW